MKRLDNATFIDKNWIERFRQPVSSYGRVMGYIRPRTLVLTNIKWWDIVTNKNQHNTIHWSWYNLWKMSEWEWRTYFKEWKTCPRNFERINAMLQDNQNFISKYMIHETTVCTKN